MKAIFILLLIINAVFLSLNVLAAYGNKNNSTATTPIGKVHGSDLPRLKLLNELSTVNDDDNSPVVSQIQKTSQPQNTNADLCSLIGPYKNLARADILVEKLAALDVSASLREVLVPGKTSYWVYLPSLGSSDAAFRKLKELQAKSIDSYVIPNGNLQYGISLGLFNEKNGAEIKQKELAAKGYEVKIHEEVRKISQNWVVASAQNASKISSERWNSLIGDQEGIVYQQNFCPDVASRE
ncbi:SPOR domain-containing protein [Sessilibacter sp. MAH2]